MSIKLPPPPLLVDVMSLTPFSVVDLPHTSRIKVNRVIPKRSYQSREESIKDFCEAPPSEADVLWYAASGSGAYFLAQDLVATKPDLDSIPVLGFSDVNYHQLGLMLASGGRCPSYYCRNLTEDLSDEYLESVCQTVGDNQGVCFDALDWIKAPEYRSDFEQTPTFIISGNLQILADLFSNTQTTELVYDMFKKLKADVPRFRFNVLFLLEVSNADMQPGDFYRVEIALWKLLQIMNQVPSLHYGYGIVLTETCYGILPDDPLHLHGLLHEVLDRAKYRSVIDTLCFCGVTESLGHTLTTDLNKTPVLPIGLMGSTLFNNNERSLFVNWSTK